MIEGVSEEELDRILAEEQGEVVDEEVKPAWRWRGLVIAVNLVVLGALLALFYWRWWTKR
jgi:predicted negative regulator of RcsB-dependent stress response